MAAKSAKRPFPPIVSIVGFHHAKGPDVEHWFGGDEDLDDTCTDSEWPFFPFMALCDGSHSFEQDFSYFTLKREARGSRPASSLFGISCTMQLDARLLKEKKTEVTRSTVQKAVVVITDSPVYFGHLREQLVMVTSAWFAQRNFDDLEIIKKFRESLVHSICDREDGFDRETYLGMVIGLSLREFIYRFKQNALVLFKCALLQPKMLFFSSKSCEKLCMTQFSLVSLIPGLLENLQDASDPELNSYEENLKVSSDLRTSDRKSLLAYMGCPLQVFGKGSLFGPYTPLQQLDMLADKDTKSYIVGSTNSLLLQQKDRYSDIIVNLDDGSVNITSASLRNALLLTPADRRWINVLTQTVVDSWDENDPSRPKTMGFTGSEDYIRMQFEEYILALLSSVKYSNYLEKFGDEAGRLPDIEGDPSVDFGVDWVHQWKATENYRIFSKFTEDNLFDVIPPRHVYAGARAYEELTRRINQQVAELKLNEKVIAGRAAVTQTLAQGSRKVSAAITSFWADIEKSRKEREAQQKALEEMERYNAELVAHDEKRRAASRPGSIRTDVSSVHEHSPTRSPLPQTQPAGTDMQSRASAYLSSWASWAGEKRKKAFSPNPQDPQSSKSTSSSPPPNEQQSNGIHHGDYMEMTDTSTLSSAGKRSMDTIDTVATGKTKDTAAEVEGGDVVGGAEKGGSATVVEKRVSTKLEDTGRLSTTVVYSTPDIVPDTATDASLENSIEEPAMSASNNDSGKRVSKDVDVGAVKNVKEEQPTPTIATPAAPEVAPATTAKDS